jgi:adenylyltransferase/sulfurtransferase
VSAPAPLTPPLTADEHARYARQLILPGVGDAGQQRLRRARVLVVGAGGLGSSVALHLAAAGVGTVGLVDDDRVDASNLHRQLLYGTGDLGRPKLDAAAARLGDLNPHVCVERHQTRLTAANARALAAGYDLVVDGTDNFAARYAVNDACVALGVPNVYGSVHRFEGQVAVFAAPGGPCYRCLHPAPPPDGLVPDCAAGGVLGVLPGLVGTLQAAEALKLLLGVGEPLAGRLLVVDALTMRFLRVAVARDPACPVCGDAARTAGGAPPPAAAPSHAPSDAPADLPGEITAAALAAALDGPAPPVVLDVREPHEWNAGHLAAARPAPAATLDAAAAGLDPARPVVTVCAAGVRSAAAARRLRALGFADVRSLAGGVAAWQVMGGALVGPDAGCGPQLREASAEQDLEQG